MKPASEADVRKARTLAEESLSSSPGTKAAAHATDDPLQTLEVRWRHGGPRPAELYRVLASLDPEPSEWSDVYVEDTKENVAVKISDGNFIDVRRRLDHGTVGELVPGVTGLLERWETWVFESQADWRTEERLGGRADWIPVRRTRWAAPETENRVHMEVATIVRADIEWWSFAARAELFGDDVAAAVGGLREVFRLAPVHTTAGFELTAANTCSYTAWLSL